MVFQEDLVIFTPDNWNIPQEIKVFAVDDTRIEPRYHSATIHHSASSFDSNYNNIPISSVQVKIIDND